MICEKIKKSDYCSNGKDVILSHPSNFSLDAVFSCGQCFRFNKVSENTYAGVAHGKYLVISETSDSIVFRNTTVYDFENIWYDYFDLDFDYGECIDSFSGDATLRKAADFSKGIRILHQEHWETLCSFIISQNNNIPRIKKIINALCEKYGEYICDDDNGIPQYSFPDAQTLYYAGEKAIFDLKTGFRAKYITDAAKCVCSGETDFSLLERISADDALSELCKIKGVGPKVASCVLLFSFRKYDCFPIDVWMKRIISEYFPDFTGKEYFGKYAGIAQQYLFYYERCLHGITI